MQKVRVPTAPNLPAVPQAYDRIYFENLNTIFRFFFLSVVNSLNSPVTAAKNLLRIREDTYNVSPIDTFGVLVFDSSAPSTINVLSNSAFRQQGEYLEIVNTGSGTVTLVGGAGVTLHPPSPTVLADSKITLLYLGSNNWFAA